MKSKTTLKQIALNLGVSVSTVSKALNDSPEISEATKLRVQEFAKLNNYKPNITALNLKNQSTKTIGVIIPNILNSFFAKVFSGIEMIADEKGYNVITCISNESIQKEIDTLQMLSNGTIDGFIISISEESQKNNQFNHFTDILNDGIPIVMFDRVTEKVNCDKVIVDDFESAVNATQHLIDTGCKKIALFSSINNLSVGKLRANGYFEAIKKNNIEIDNNIVVLTDSNKEFESKISLFFKENKIDAIFAVDESTSVAAIKLGLKYGYKIPDDLSVIGFADGIWSKRLTPSLSTVSQHGPEIGKTAALLLIQKLESKNKEKQNETIIIKTELRKRESTKKIK